MSGRRGNGAWWRGRIGLPLALAVLGGGAAAESGGRLLYSLNCLGCHPMPERDPGDFDGQARHVGAFYQTEAGRRFFIRLPAPGSPPLNAAAERLLQDEIVAWKGACFALTASTPLIRNRHVGGRQ